MPVNPLASFKSCGIIFLIPDERGQGVLISRLVQRVILPANPAQISKVGSEPGIHPTE